MVVIRQAVINLVLLFSLFNFPSFAFGATLNDSLTLRDGFDLGDIDSRTSDDPKYNLVDPFSSFTDGNFYEIGEFSGHEGSSNLEITLLGHVAGFTDTIGYWDEGGTFNSLVSSTDALGTTASITQNADDAFKFGIETPRGFFSAIDSENQNSEIQVIASTIVTAGLLELPFANKNDESFSFNLEVGDVVIWMEDLRASKGDFDFNDLVVVARHSEINKPIYSISGTVFYSDGTTPLANATVTIPTATFETGADGTYIFNSLRNGDYTVTSSKTDFTFSDNPRDVTINNTSLTNVDFIALTEPAYTISGGAFTEDGTPVEGVTIKSDGSDVSSTDSLGAYLVNDVTRGSYVYSGSFPNAIVEVNGFTNPVVVFDANVTDINFVVRCIEGFEFLNSICSEIEEPPVDEPTCEDPAATLNDDGECITTTDEPLKSPVFTKYNTFLSQWNFLELIAGGTATVEAKVTVFSINGEIIDTVEVSIEPRTQQDIDIHSIVNKIDTYGLIKIEFNEDTPGAELLGRITMYRQNPGAEDYSFAFARELRNPITGQAFATGNSYDPQGKGYLVPNWMEIANIDEEVRIFTHKVYNQDGEVIQDRTISLPPFGQYDINAGHEFGEGVYLNEVIPHSTTAPYLAAVSRYSSNHNSGAEAATYNFAFSLQAKSGKEEAQYTAITNDTGACWSQTNWVEVVNTLNESATATIIFRDALGNTIDSDSMTLAPRAQYHFNGSAILAESGAVRGSVAVVGDKADSLLVQSLIYYHDCKSNGVQTAYASVGKTPQGAVQIGSLNTNLDMTNILSLIPVDMVGFDTTIKINTFTTGERETTISSSEFAVQEVSFEEGSALEMNPDVYGTVTVETVEVDQVVAETLRIRERADGGIDFVIPTMVK